MYDLLLKMFEGVDSEEYKAFTATLHKILRNVAKLPQQARGHARNA